ncbi:MAG TPA: ATP-binding protein [Burkholderiales bacterium]|nr:ATP-binding protein [Burkholderiales bacterium]
MESPRFDAGAKTDGASAPGAVKERSLLQKYIAYLVALVSSVLLVSGLVGLYFTYEESKAARLNLQREKAMVAAARVEAYLQRIEQQIKWAQFVASEDERRTQFERIRAPMREIITEISAVHNSGCLLLRFSGINDFKRGCSFVLGAREPPVELNEEERRGYAATRTRESDWFYFRKDRVPYLSISIRTNPEDAIIGQVDLSDLATSFSDIERTDKTRIYVVDGGGELIADADISRVLKRKAQKVSYVMEALGGVDEALPGRVARNEKGHDVLVANAAVKRLGWRVFVEQPLSDAMAPIKASLARTLFLLLAGLAVAVLFSVALARHMVMPIRTIQAGAGRIAAGHLDQRLDVRTGDELEALAREFNVMARQLNESYSGLERKVAERTRDLAEALEQQTATSEVLKKISRSSFDLDVLLDELIQCAAALAHADAGALYLRHSERAFKLQTAYSSHPGLHDLMSSMISEIAPGPNSATGRAIVTGHPAQIVDVSAEPDYLWPQAGFSTVLAVPILKDRDPIGVIVVLNAEKKRFTDKQVDLVATFADQAGIAIQNVRLLDESKKKTHALERANLHKSRFLANVSHELRTPLNAIIGFSDVLRERMFGELNDKQAEYVEDIHGSGRHLLSLINDILNLAKIEAGHMELELSTVDVPDALQNAVSLVRERANSKGVALALEEPEDLGSWIADERKLKQVMLNLLSNAIKFTPAGGEVTVRAAQVGDVLEIAVSDTGVGIAKGDQEVIFDEFRQVAGPGREEGTGLGLPLARKFVELHGGRIDVRSEIGRGSTFVCTFPAVTGEPA